MNQTGRPSRSAPPIYIFSTPYTHLSGGPIALHTLCHHLNLLGYESYVTSQELSGTLFTPLLTDRVVQAHVREGRNPIVLYPEIVVGNPLGAQRVVRWLLNRPGARGPAGDWSPAARAGEYFLHYCDEYHPPGLPSDWLFVPIVDRKIYCPPASENREGYVIYQHRVSVELSSLPDWVKPFTVVSMANPRTAPQLAALYQKAKAFITFEGTGAQYEALFCNCPALVVLNPHFNEKSFYSIYGDTGLGWALDEREIARSRATMPAFFKTYDALLDGLPTRVDRTFRRIFTFFGEAGWDY